MTIVPTTASEKPTALSPADRRYNAWTVCLCVFMSLIAVLIVFACFAIAFASEDEPGFLGWSLFVISLIGTTGLIVIQVMNARDWRTARVPEPAPKAWRDLTFAEWQEGVRKGRS